MAKRTLRRPKSYGPKRRFELVLESFRGERSDTEIARRPWSAPGDVLQLETTVPKAPRRHLRRQPREQAVRASHRRAGTGTRAERGGAGPPQEFFGGSLTVDQKVELVNQHRPRYGLNTCLRALGLSKGTWHHRQHRRSPELRDQPLKQRIRAVIEDHPYGYRPILAELNDGSSEACQPQATAARSAHVRLGLPRCFASYPDRFGPATDSTGRLVCQPGARTGLRRAGGVRHRLHVTALCRRDAQSLPLHEGSIPAHAGEPRAFPYMLRLR